MTKGMRRCEQRKLEKCVPSDVDGSEVEEIVLNSASEMGYEVEDEYDTQQVGGGVMHNVKVVNSEGRSAWIHFNRPSSEYASNKGEWFWYIM